MRDERELYRVHDAIAAMILGEALPPGVVLPEEVKRELNTIGSTLCWVLEHDHNTYAADVIQYVFEYMKEAGVEMVELPRVMQPEEREEYIRVQRDTNDATAYAMQTMNEGGTAKSSVPQGSVATEPSQEEGPVIPSYGEIPTSKRNSNTYSKTHSRKKRH